MRLRGNSSNVCQGRLETEEPGNQSWIPVTDPNTISPQLACHQLFCGTNASQTEEGGGVQLNCTGGASE